MKRKIATIVLSSVLSMSLLIGCGKQPEPQPQPVDTTSGNDIAEFVPEPVIEEPEPEPEPEPITEIDICLGAEPANLDPALALTSEQGTIITHLFSGLARYEQQADGSCVAVADCAIELGEGIKNNDGTITYVYTFKDNLVWSDGEPVTPDDFIFAWNRSAAPTSPREIRELFSMIDGYDAMQEKDENGKLVDPSAQLNVKAPNSKTLMVTLSRSVPYWNQLLTMPAFMPLPEHVVRFDEDWAMKSAGYTSNGPYTLANWEHNYTITFQKNNDYTSASDVQLETINCLLSDDKAEIFSLYKEGRLYFIDEVPADKMLTIKRDYMDQYHNDGGLGVTYAYFNIDWNPLYSFDSPSDKDKATARQALSLVVNRDYIVTNISQNNEIPASNFIAAGVLDYDSTHFYQNCGHDYAGYWDASTESYNSNVKTAVNSLKSYLEYDTDNKIFSKGIYFEYMKVEDQDEDLIMKSINDSLRYIGCGCVSRRIDDMDTYYFNRSTGNFTFMHDSYTSIINDPIGFLDLWTSTSPYNYAGLGKGNHALASVYNLDLTDLGYDVQVENGTWAETYDVLINKMKHCKNAENYYKMAHLAEDMLMSTGCIVPLYFDTDMYMVESDLIGAFSDPLGYKHFSTAYVDVWGTAGTDTETVVSGDTTEAEVQTEEVEVVEPEEVEEETETIEESEETESTETSDADAEAETKEVTE